MISFKKFFIKIIFCMNDGTVENSAINLGRVLAGLLVFVCGCYWRAFVGTGVCNWWEDTNGCFNLFPAVIVRKVLFVVYRVALLYWRWHVNTYKSCFCRPVGKDMTAGVPYVLHHHSFSRLIEFEFVVVFADLVISQIFMLII